VERGLAATVHFSKSAPQKNAPAGFAPNGTRSVAAFEACDFRNLMTKMFPQDTEKCDSGNLLTKNAPSGFIPVERGLAATVHYSKYAHEKHPSALLYASGDNQSV
jgi:hypothetical protein